MAGPVLKFNRKTTDLSLLSTSTFALDAKRGGYIPGVAPALADGEPAPIIETIPTFSQVASDDAMATQEQALAAMAFYANRYMTDPAELYPVWLHCQMKAETGERRALVHSITYSPTVSRFDPSVGPSTRHFTHNIVVKRSPYWERAAYRLFPKAAPDAAASVAYDYTAAGTSVTAHDIVGDVPARIGGFMVKPTNASTMPLDRFWMGIRSANKRQITNWVGAWECENGGNTALSSDANEATTASGGAKVTGTPTGDDTWEKYMLLELDDVYSTDADRLSAMGTFLWLMRAKLEAAGSYDVQLRFGYTYNADSTYIRGPVFTVDSTSWDYYEAGIQSVPRHDEQARTPYDILRATNYLAKFAIQIWARRTAGSGSISFDCLCPVAVDEGFIAISGANIGSTATQMAILVGPSNKVAVITGVMSYNTTVELLPYASGAAVNMRNWMLPPGDGRIDIVYAQAAASVLTDTIILNGETTTNDDTGAYYERWVGLRGGQ